MINLKQGGSPEQRQQVIELRRTHSFREVDSLTGLAIGTVKTIVSRSGAFRDNEGAPATVAPRFSQSENVARTMSSREIAKLTGKAHKHVLADIRSMLKELEID